MCQERKWKGKDIKNKREARVLKMKRKLKVERKRNTKNIVRGIRKKTEKIIGKEKSMK